MWQLESHFQSTSLGHNLSMIKVWVLYTIELILKLMCYERGLSVYLVRYCSDAVK